MIDVVISGFWATMEQLAYLVVPIIAIYMVMNIIAEFILGSHK